MRLVASVLVMLLGCRDTIDTRAENKLGAGAVCRTSYKDYTMTTCVKNGTVYVCVLNRDEEVACGVTLRPEAQ